MIGNFGAGVATIESFSPGQSGWFAGNPLVIACSGHYSFNGYMLSQRQAGQLEFQFSGCIPYFNFLREIIERQEIRVRPMKPYRQDVLAIRRGVDASVEPRLAYLDCLATFDQQQLGG